MFISSGGSKLQNIYVDILYNHFLQ